MTENARESAYLLVQLGRGEKALEILAPDFDVEDPWSWHARGAALLSLERYGEAAEAAQEGLGYEPEHPYLLDLLAAARIALRDLAGAEEAILAALRIDAEDPDFLSRYGYVVAHAGQLEKAEKLVMRALAIDPENTFALELHAFLATAGGDRQEAIIRSQNLLRHVPEHPTAHRLLGAAHYEAGEIDAASDHLTRAVRFDPSDDNVAEAAREARAKSHWLLWPLRPIIRWGPGPVWIAAIAIMFTLRALKLPGLSLTFVAIWVAYCVYSWVVPPLVRRFARRW